MRKSAIAFAVALAATGLVGCGSQDSPFDIPVGACADSESWSADTTEVESLPTVDCAAEHDMEAYASMELDDAEFPGADAIEEEASDFCVAEFESFIGLPYADSTEIDINYLYPTEDSWNSRDDREILCWAVDVSGTKVTGTMKGANR